MQIISKYLNFTWEIHYPLNGEYGDVQPDGSEDGMVGEARQLNNIQFIPTLKFNQNNLQFFRFWTSPSNILQYLGPISTKYFGRLYNIIF